MANDTGEGEMGDDSIKSAVRDAARKTQERMAAYQQKQSARAAATAAAEVEKANAPPTKEKKQIESTVTRLQALVSESKRLTNQSQKLNTLPAVPIAAAAPTADEIAPSSAATKPKSDLPEIMRNMNLAKGPAFGRSSTTEVTSRSSKSKIKKGKELGAIFKKLGESQASLNNSSSSLPHFSADLATIIQESGGGTSSLTPSSESKTTIGSDDSVKALLAPISGLSLNKFASSSQKSAVEAARKEQEVQQKVLASLSVADVAEVKFNDDGDGGDNDSHSSGEVSIMSVVEVGKKKKEIKVNGMEVDLDDAEEMMDDYYSNSHASLSSLPCLDHMGDASAKSSKSKSKKKKKQSKKKKADTNSKEKVPMPAEDELPVLDDIMATPKQNKAKFGDMDDDEFDALLGASMPGLDPFDTPKGCKAKMVHPSPMIQEKDNTRQGKWTKKLLAINKSLDSYKSEGPELADDNQAVNATDTPAQLAGEQNSPMRIAENSMNLSQVFQQSMSDTSSKRGITPVGNTPIRRPSLENVKEEEQDGDDDNKSVKSRRSSSRMSRGSNTDDDDKSVMSSRSSRSKSSKSRRKSKKNVPPKRKKSFADGDDMAGSSNLDKPVEVEKGKEGTMTRDVSELSIDDYKNNMEDGSGLSESSKSGRRGRNGTLGGNSGHSQTSSRRGVSRSASTRSQSRSASVRRRRAANLPRSNTAKSDGMEDGSMRDASLRSQSFRDNSRRTKRDNGASLRDGSFRDTSRRRCSISTRHASRRSQRKSEDDEVGTADDILNSLDVSDIKIVGETENGDDSPMEDDSRTSIYDKKERRASVKEPVNKSSLAGLTQLQSTADTGQTEENDDDSSVADSVQSNSTKKSRMSIFAKNVGRKLTGKKSKDKKGGGTAAEVATANGADDSSGGEEEDGDDVAVDKELAALAAEYDAEEEELENGEDILAGGNPADVADNDGIVSKSKKGRAKSMFSAIKKVGKLTKKRKKKDKKDKTGEALDSDSESEGDELRESENSAGTLDQSGSDGGESDSFAQVQFDGDKASVSMSGSNDAEDALPSTPTRSRQRRSSAVDMRRQRADRQRAQSLHAVLGNSMNRPFDDDTSVQGSAKTADTTRIRSRRAQSLRTRIPRRGENDAGEEAAQVKPSKDLRRAKSLKVRIEVKSPEKLKRIRRSKTAEMAAMKNIEENEEPAFDWQTYSADNNLAPGKKAARDRKKSTKAKELDKRMSGGLSKLIYHQQEVAN